MLNPIISIHFILILNFIIFKYLLKHFIHNRFLMNLQGHVWYKLLKYFQNDLLSLLEFYCFLFTLWIRKCLVQSLAKICWFPNIIYILKLFYFLFIRLIKEFTYCQSLNFANYSPTKLELFPGNIKYFI